MVYHSDHFAPEQCDAYWETVAAGVQWPPVYRSDFGVLEQDHGIKHPGRRAQRAAYEKARFEQPATWGPVPMGLGTVKRLQLVESGVPREVVALQGGPNEVAPPLDQLPLFRK